MKTFDSELSRLNSGEVALLSQIASLKEDINSQSSKNNSLLDENIQLSSKLNYLEQEVHNLQRKLSYSQASVERSHTQMKSAVTQRNLYQKQANQFFNHLMEIRSQLKGTSEIFDDLMASHKYKIEIKMLREELGQKEEKLQSVRSELDEVIKSIEQDKEQQWGLIQSLESMYLKLETKFAISEDEKEHL